MTSTISEVAGPRRDPVRAIWMATAAMATAYLVLGGIGIFLATAMGTGGHTALGGYRPESPLSIGWLLAAGCLAVGVTHASAPSSTAIGSSDRIRSPGRRVVTYAAASLVLPGVMLVRARDLTESLVAAGTAGILALVTIQVRCLLDELELARASEVAEVADQRQRDHRRFEALVRHAADVLLVVGASGSVHYASPSSAAMFGADPTGWSQARLTELMHPDEREATLAALLDRLAARDGRPIRLRARLLDRDDREIHVEIVAVDLLDDPDVAGLVITIHDTTERAELERELRRLAFHDPLTGLPNRVLFQDRLVQALGRASRTGRRVAVLLCDLDDFKDVNDTLGHPSGDELLRALGERFSASLRATDTVARIGGDEFAVLCEDLGATRDAVFTAQRLLAATDAPIRVGDHELRIGLSVGIAVDCGDRSADEMLRDADVALYEAKAQGKRRWSLHRAIMTIRAQARLQLGVDLEQAVERREIATVYQPIHELAGGRLVGAEALARWQHPQRGAVPPEEFIGVAEQSGLILQLGDQVLEAALDTIRTWSRQMPGRVLKMGVNVSPRQLRDLSLRDRIEASLERYGVSGDRLILELTESVMLEDPEESVRVMRSLRELGVRFAIDDFGTGYSSLSYLRQLPVDIVKIDRSFVHELTVDHGTHELVRSIVDLASGLGLDVVAEGVETELHYELVRDLGCGFAQGYLFGRPTEPDAFREALASGATVSATDGVRAAVLAPHDARSALALER